MDRAHALRVPIGFLSIYKSREQSASSDREFVKSAIRGINNGGNRDRFFSLLFEEKRRKEGRERKKLVGKIVSDV